MKEIKILEEVAKFKRFLKKIKIFLKMLKI